LRPALWVRR